MHIYNDGMFIYFCVTHMSCVVIISIAVKEANPKQAGHDSSSLRCA